MSSRRVTFFSLSTPLCPNVFTYCHIIVEWYNIGIMKKYTFAIVFAVLALVAVNTALAGGGFEDYTLNPDGTVKTTNNTNGEMVGETTGEVTYDENGNVISQGAEASGAIKALGTPKGLGAIALIVLIVGGLSYWSYKKSQPTV